MLPVHADVYDVQWDRYEQQDEPEEHGENVQYDECQMSYDAILLSVFRRTVHGNGLFDPPAPDEIYLAVVNTVSVGDITFIARTVRGQASLRAAAHLANSQAALAYVAMICDAILMLYVLVFHFNTSIFHSFR